MQAELAPLLLAFQGGAVSSDVVINEFLAQNNTVIQDPFGAFEDYVELYNKGTTTIDLSGMYMSDSFLTPTEWQFPAGITLAGRDAAALNDGGCGIRAYDQLDPFAHPLGLSASGTGSIGTLVTLTGTGFQPIRSATWSWASRPRTPRSPARG